MICANQHQYGPLEWCRDCGHLGALHNSPDGNRCQMCAVLEVIVTLDARVRKLEQRDEGIKLL